MKYKNTITHRKSKYLRLQFGEQDVDPLLIWFDTNFRAIFPGDSVEKERDYILYE